jgi:amidase
MPKSIKPKKRVQRQAKKDEALPNKAWQEIARDAQETRDKSLKSIWPDLDSISSNLPTHLSTNVATVPDKFLSEEEVDITNLSIKEIVQKASAGQLSTQAVTSAFLKRMVIAQGLTNCITEALHDRASKKARQLDEHVAENGSSSLSLHGIPISVKSHIGVAGCRMACGYVALYENVAKEDALVLNILDRAGGIVHARTTEPQTMMHLECQSNLYGTTRNPQNTDLSSGGSSGGEAALLGLRGSLIGVGSDVGGSIRVPAAACGIYGLKPTSFRVPTKGWSSTPPGADPIQTVLGPMSVSLDGIEIFMKTVLAAEPWKIEPAIVPIPWRDVDVTPKPGRKLRLGYMIHDEVVLPHPPILRAMEELVGKLMTLADVEIVEVKPYQHGEAWAIVSSLYVTDGGKADIEIMTNSGEPFLPLTKWMIEHNPCVKDLSRQELEYWLEEREEFRLEYNEHWNKTGVWNERNEAWEKPVDAIICPVAPWIASKHNTAKYWSYSAIWNLLDYPALAFPVGRANKSLDVSSRSEFFSDIDKEIWQQCKFA